MTRFAKIQGTCKYIIDIFISEWTVPGTIVYGRTWSFNLMHLFSQ